MVQRNLILSPDTDSKEALIIVRSLCLNEDSVLFGLAAGLRYLKMHLKRFGYDHSTDVLATLVVQCCNRVGIRAVSPSHVEDSVVDCCSASKLVLDAYQTHPKPYGLDYAEDRCTCLYVLGRLLLKRSKWLESIRLLRESESLFQPIDGSVSLQEIQSSLSMALLAHGDVLPAATKSKSVLHFFQSAASPIGSQGWGHFAEAALTYSRACMKMDKPAEVSDTLALLRDLNSASNGSLDVTISLVEKEILRKHRVPSTSRSNVRRQTPSSRRRVFSFESQSVVIRPPEAEATAIQADEDEERSKSLPPMPRAGLVKQFVQSPRNLGMSEWKTFHSRSSGKVYYYNTRTGVSTWSDPNA